jgi:hypothetical protein
MDHRDVIFMMMGLWMGILVMGSFIFFLKYCFFIIYVFKYINFCYSIGWLRYLIKKYKNQIIKNKSVE